MGLVLLTWVCTELAGSSCGKGDGSQDIASWGRASAIRRTYMGAGEHLHGWPAPLPHQSLPDISTGAPLSGVRDKAPHRTSSDPTRTFPAVAFHPPSSLTHPPGGVIFILIWALLITGLYPLTSPCLPVLALQDSLAPVFIKPGSTFIAVAPLPFLPTRYSAARFSLPSSSPFQEAVGRHSVCRAPIRKPLSPPP